MRTRYGLSFGAALVVPALWILASGDDATPSSPAAPTGTVAPNNPSSPDAGGPPTRDAADQDATHQDAGDGGVERGPLTLDFDPGGTGDPISMHWDDAKKRLF